MFCLKSTEVLCKEVRCFCTSGAIFYSPPKKSFLKISYISYTSTHNIQHLLAFSGVGLGVG